MENRAKIFLAAAAILASTIALVSREREKARNRAGYASNIKEARIAFEDFSGARFRRGRKLSELKARSGYLLEPNMIELFGDVRMSVASGSSQSNGWDRVYCETATAHFFSSNLAEMVNSSALDRVELRGFVRFETSDVKLESDSATFYRKSGQLVSYDPVLVSGGGQEFRGEGGFEFDTIKGDLHVLGPVRGGGAVEVP